MGPTQRYRDETVLLKHSLADQNGGVIRVELRQRRDAIELTVADSRIAPRPMFAPSLIVTAMAQGLNGEAFVKDAGGWVAGARIPSDPAVPESTERRYAMHAQHSFAALDLAMRMDAADAAWLVSIHQRPELLLPPGAPPVNPLHLQAAHIVCEWVDMYGPCPSLH